MTARRIIISAAALGTAALIARWPLGAANQGSRITDLREEIAYRWSGRALRFAMPPGAEPLRLLVNVDQRGEAPMVGLPLVVRVTTASDGKSRDYALWAEPGTDDRHQRAVLYLDGDEWPTRTAMLGLQRTIDAADEWTVALAVPAGSTASVRLLVREARAAHRGQSLGRPEAAFVAAAAVGRLLPPLPAIAGEGAPPDEQWAKVAAAASTPTRRLYFRDSALRPPPSPASPPLGPDQIVALTVQGPGSVTVHASSAAAVGTVRVLQAQGQQRALPVNLAVDQAIVVPLAPGLQTLRFDGALNAPLTVTGAPPVAGTLASARARPDGDVELSPRWVVEDFARAEPEPETPVAFAVGARRGVELLFRVRALMHAREPEHRVVLRFQITGAGGRALETRAIALLATPAPEDLAPTVDGRLLSLPMSVFLWPPVGADVVRISTSEAVEIAAASPAWPDDRPAADAPPSAAAAAIASHVRLRFGDPEPQRPFFPVWPLNRAQLLAQERIDRLRLAPRLELLPPVESRPAPSLAPLGVVPRVDVLAPLTQPVTTATRGLYWPLPARQEVRIGARAVAPSLLYLGGARTRRATARIFLDGASLGSEPLFTARGRLRLRLPTGPHRLRVNVPKGVDLYVSRPVENAAPQRFLSVYPLDGRRGLHLRVAKGSIRRTVGVVLYGVGPAPATARLRATIDGGRRRLFAHLSQDRSRLTREFAVATQAIPGARALNTGVAPTWVSDPMFIVLGDDLPAGVHRVRLRGQSAGQVMARLFLVEPPVQKRPLENFRAGRPTPREQKR
ncbi:MAG TPA: hypothetical protein VGL59_00545 [Polyangia bacterium]